MRRTLYHDDHEAYRDSVRTFLAKEVGPRYADWERARIAQKARWLPGIASGRTVCAIAMTEPGPRVHRLTYLPDLRRHRGDHEGDRGPFAATRLKGEPQ
jgi:alkylation response protein AidB-like acyl-CoA dehydrogenase